MTKKSTTSDVHNNGGKRIMKPVVEKKRRDRINQSLRELRTLLLNHTSDVRLKNPKIEKAEILDLAVEYLNSWTDRPSITNDSDDTCGHIKADSPPTACHSQPSNALSTIETAGFQQCMAQLANYMHKITPEKRTGLIQELRGYMDTQCSTGTERDEHCTCRITDASLKMDDVEASITMSEPRPLAKVGCSIKEDTFVSRQSLCQAGILPYSMPGHEYLSPPPSPFFSHPSSAFTTPPPFTSAASCHFSFSPRLSPLSDNTSLSIHVLPQHSLPVALSLSPTLSLASPLAFNFPSPVSFSWSPVLTPREALPANHALSVWRPWF